MDRGRLEAMEKPAERLEVEMTKILKSLSVSKKITKKYHDHVKRLIYLLHNIRSDEEWRREIIENLDYIVLFDDKLQVAIELRKSRTMAPKSVSTNVDKERLILSSLHKVRQIAKSFQKKYGLPQTFALEDLISAGNLGLVEAAENFQPERHGHFSGFCHQYIQKSIEASLGNYVKSRKFLDIRESIIHDLRQKLGREPEQDEIGSAIYDYDSTFMPWWKKFGMRGFRVMVRGVNSPSISLDSLTPEMKDAIIGGYENDPDLTKLKLSHLYAKEKVYDAFDSALAVLTKKERDILIAHFGKDLSFRQISNKLNLDYDKIMEIYHSGKFKLRKALLDKLKEKK